MDSKKTGKREKIKNFLKSSDKKKIIKTTFFKVLGFIKTGKRKKTILKNDSEGIQIRVPVTSKNGKGWLRKFEIRGGKAGVWAKGCLKHLDFKIEEKYFDCVIHKSTEFDIEDRNLSEIKYFGQKKKYGSPHPEVACFIAETFTPQQFKDIDIEFIIVLHELIPEHDEFFLLGAQIYKNKNGEDSVGLFSFSVNKTSLYQNFREKSGFCFLSNNQVKKS